MGTHEVVIRRVSVLEQAMRGDIMGAKEYTAKEIAHYIVNKCIHDRKPISNLQLQKILYFVQERYIKSTGNLLFSDDFVAWKYGPVILSIYNEFSGNGGSLITKEPSEYTVDGFVQEIINPVIDKYREMYPWDLVGESHKSGGAWDRTFKNGEGCGDKIPQEFMAEDAICQK